IWNSLNAIGNYRLSPIPVLILYDVQSSQTADSLFNSSSLSPCCIATSSNKKPMLWHRLE
ncbi:hypothetical protein, partial [Vibrio cholerae]|uniref:hypothetical protein n=1 Tax=Vibrio cholerae TaxID=666 RepID=UPI001962EA53